MTRRGFVLSMWTGLLENPRTGRPILFSSPESARRALRRYPSWGRSAVDVRECKVRANGRNGLPDYIVGSVVQ